VEANEEKHTSEELNHSRNLLDPCHSVNRPDGQGSSKGD